MDSLTLALVMIAILIVLCFWLLILLERTSQRASIARMESARMMEGHLKAEQGYAQRAAEALLQAMERNDRLVDRMAGMMREGFVEIPPLEQEGEGDASESGEKWPPLSAQEYRDSTGHWPPEEERHWSLHQS